MAANLHFAVCEVYRQAISERRAEREAFDMATSALCERHPGIRPAEARRRVAEMLCNDPPGSGVTGAQGVSEMTDKSPNKFSLRPEAPLHPAGAGSISDRCETASADSFPASDAPAWTAVTGSGAPRTGRSPLHNQEQSS